MRQVSEEQLAECLPEVLRSAEAGDTVTITRNGKTVATLLGNQELKRLRAEVTASQVVEGSLAELAGRWSDADDLAQTLDDVVGQRDHADSRPIPDLQ